jgi:Transposase zinc-ribbon domain
MAGRPASRVRGLSEADFRETDGTEERCRAVVEKLRWPAGFVCPLFGGHDGKWLSTRPKIECRARRHRVSPTAGAVFHATELPLTTWFLAMRLIATAKNGISSIELGRRLGIERTNAWSLKQKIMAVMTAQGNTERPDGWVETDDAYPGGHHPSERGRGVAGKQPLVAAVPTSDGRRPREIKLLPVEGFRKKEIGKLVAGRLTSKSRLVADGLGCAGPSRPRLALHIGRSRPAAAGKQRGGRPSNGSTRPSATSRRRSPAPTARSVPSMPAVTSPASPGATADASTSRSPSHGSSTAPSGPLLPLPSTRRELIMQAN